MNDKTREAVARAIWNIRREEEDRCDMELEDIGPDHSVWAEAEAAIAAIEVELPGHDCDPGWNAAVRDCRIAIESLGLKVNHE